MLLLNEAARQWDEHYRARRSYSTVTIPLGGEVPDAQAFWDSVMDRMDAAIASAVHNLEHHLFRPRWAWARTSWPAHPATDIGPEFCGLTHSLPVS